MERRRKSGKRRRDTGRERERVKRYSGKERCLADVEKKLVLSNGKEATVNRRMLLLRPFWAVAIAAATEGIHA